MLETYQMRCQRCEKIKYNQTKKDFDTRICDDCKKEIWWTETEPLLVFMLVLWLIIILSMIMFW